MHRKGYLRSQRPRSATVERSFVRSRILRIVRSRWVLGTMVAVGALVALAVPLAPCVQDSISVYAAPGPCDNPVPIRLGIAGGTALAVLLLAGISRSRDRRRLWGGAMALAIALAVALAVPRGGPYGGLTHYGIRGSLYSFRNPLRVAITSVGALAASFILFANFSADRTPRDAAPSGEPSMDPISG
jgi:hypothetical protein